MMIHQQKIAEALNSLRVREVENVTYTDNFGREFEIEFRQGPFFNNIKVEAYLESTRKKGASNLQIYLLFDSLVRLSKAGLSPMVEVGVYQGVGLKPNCIDVAEFIIKFDSFRLYVGLGEFVVINGEEEEVIFLEYVGSACSYLISARRSINELVD